MGVASHNIDKMRLQIILFIPLADHCRIPVSKHNVAKVRETGVEECACFTGENEIL
jgi:hypothetical protein